MPTVLRYPAGCLAVWLEKLLMQRILVVSIHLIHLIHLVVCLQSVLASETCQVCCDTARLCHGGSPPGGYSDQTGTLHSFFCRISELGERTAQGSFGHCWGEIYVYHLVDFKVTCVQPLATGTYLSKYTLGGKTYC